MKKIWSKKRFQVSPPPTPPPGVNPKTRLRTFLLLFPLLYTTAEPKRVQFVSDAAGIDVVDAAVLLCCCC